MTDLFYAVRLMYMTHDKILVFRVNGFGMSCISQLIFGEFCVLFVRYFSIIFADTNGVHKELFNHANQELKIASDSCFKSS